MKIQHLETFISPSATTQDIDYIQEEIMQTFIILINALSCLSFQHRWIVVDKVFTPTADEGGKSCVTRVALKLSDLNNEYRSYVEKKQVATARNLNLSLCN